MDVHHTQLNFKLSVFRTVIVNAYGLQYFYKFNFVAVYFIFGG